MLGPMQDPITNARRVIEGNERGDMIGLARRSMQRLQRSAGMVGVSARGLLAGRIALRMRTAG